MNLVNPELEIVYLKFSVSFDHTFHSTELHGTITQLNEQAVLDRDENRQLRSEVENWRSIALQSRSRTEQLIQNLKERANISVTLQPYAQATGLEPRSSGYSANVRCLVELGLSGADLADMRCKLEESSFLAGSSVVHTLQRSFFLLFPTINQDGVLVNEKDDYRAQTTVLFPSTIDLDAISPIHVHEDEKKDKIIGETLFDEKLEPLSDHKPALHDVLDLSNDEVLDISHEEVLDAFNDEVLDLSNDEIDITCEIHHHYKSTERREINESGLNGDKNATKRRQVVPVSRKIKPINSFNKTCFECVKVRSFAFVVIISTPVVNRYPIHILRVS